MHIHDLQAYPLKTFRETGIVTADDKLHEFDAVVLATGFDSFTGSLTQSMMIHNLRADFIANAFAVGLKNKDGVDISEIWNGGVSSYLGLTIAGFPNMFMVYVRTAFVKHGN